jgi:hypothetical protein
VLNPLAAYNAPLNLERNVVMNRFQTLLSIYQHAYTRPTIRIGLYPYVVWSVQVEAPRYFAFGKVDVYRPARVETKT